MLQYDVVGQQLLRAPAPPAGAADADADAAWGYGTLPVTAPSAPPPAMTARQESAYNSLTTFTRAGSQTPAAVTHVSPCAACHGYFGQLCVCCSRCLLLFIELGHLDAVDGVASSCPAQVRLPDSIYDSVASTLPMPMAHRIDAWCSRDRSAAVAKTALLGESGLKPGSFCVWRSTEGSCVLATLQAGGRVIQFPLVQVSRGRGTDSPA